jgi:hypothetical protein
VTKNCQTLVLWLSVMKILLTIADKTHKAYKATAHARKVPIRNLYAAAITDAVELDLIATLAVEPRKPRGKGKRK